MSSLRGFLRQSLENNKEAFDSEFKDLHFYITQFLMLGSDFNNLRMFDIDIFLNTVSDHIKDMKNQISYYESMTDIMYQKRRECSILGDCNKEKKIYDDYSEYRKDRASEED